MPYLPGVRPLVSRRTSSAVPSAFTESVDMSGLLEAPLPTSLALLPRWSPLPRITAWTLVPAAPLVGLTEVRAVCGRGRGQEESQTPCMLYSTGRAVVTALRTSTACSAWESERHRAPKAP